ncbi:Tigger transposable element-derived protein 6 [Cucumispora dikerogammari]|nr:Tigger transposable element-derived protein 6 [Cucumispora dikerogammari]
MIEILFFPKNVTGMIQSFDLGIIQNFKTMFLKYKLEFILQQVKASIAYYEAYRKLDMVNVLIFTDLAWKEVKIQTINNCFKKMLRADTNSALKAAIKDNLIQGYCMKIGINDYLEETPLHDINYIESDTLLSNLDQEEMLYLTTEPHKKVTCVNNENPYITTDETQPTKVTKVQESYKYNVSELLNLTEGAIRRKGGMELEDYEFLKKIIKYRKNKKVKELRFKGILRYLIKKD